ncbi:MAG: S41 family peptidase [Pyrinomonadaceae bacterium]
MIRKLFGSFLLLVLITNLAYAEWDFGRLSGEWRGELEYSDYTSGERVKVPVVVEIDSKKDRGAMSLKYFYDDFGKIIRDSETHRIDLATGAYSIDGHQYRVDSIDGNHLVLTGDTIENDKSVPARYTVDLDDDKIVFLKETREPLAFRNSLTLHRSDVNRDELRMLAASEMRHDFELLKRSLLELHPGLNRYRTPVQIAAMFHKQEMKLKTPMREDRFYRIIAETLSGVRCFHTYPNPYNQSAAVQDRLFNRRSLLPFLFEIVEGKMVVTENVSTYKLPRGTVIESINGIPTRKILADLFAMTFADGDGTRAHRLKTLETSRYDADGKAIFDILFPLVVSPIDKGFKITALKPGQNELRNAEVLALNWKERERFLNQKYGKLKLPDDAWGFEYLDGETGLLKINSFITWEMGFDFKRFLADSFSEFRRKGTKNLIIDMRGADGGSDEVYRQIFRYLSAKPIDINVGQKYYIKSPKASPEILKHAESWDKSVLNLLKVGVPKRMFRVDGEGRYELVDQVPTDKPLFPFEDRFVGEVYLLVGSRNASAAFTLPYHAKRLGLAKLIGQETGGNQRGFNGSMYLTIKLPGSGFAYDIPLVAGYFPGEPPDSGVFPDISVTRTIRGITEGKDLELERALEMMRSRVRQ